MTINQIKNMLLPVDWLKALNYWRNGNVLDLSVAYKDEATIIVSATVQALHLYVVSLVMQGTEIHACSCNCLLTGKDQLHSLAGYCLNEVKPCTPCMHITAVCLAYFEQQKDVNTLALKNPGNSTRRFKKSVLDQLRPQVQVLINWNPMLEQIRMLPRIVWKTTAGRNIIRTYPMREHNNIRANIKTNEVAAFFGKWAWCVPDETGCIMLHDEWGLSIFFNEIWPFMPSDWTLMVDDALQKRRPKRIVVTAQLKMPDIQQNGMLELVLSFHCDKLHITQEQLQRHIFNQQLYLIENGEYLEIENIAQLRKLAAIISGDNRDHTGDDRYSINTRLLAELEEWAAVQNEGAIQFDHRIKLLLSNAENVQLPSLTLSSRLEETLRHYQREGVQWMQFLRNQQFGGVLADEMGLGKTLQLLAHLSANKSSKPSLIVCPKSLMVNWLQEAKRFVPELKTILIHGQETDRVHQFRQAQTCDLIITSYPILQRDISRFSAFFIDTIILDEAQMIRNPNTRLTRVVKRVNALHRLALTGTPMENTPIDLWSIFDFVMPGFLGTEVDFRARYMTNADYSVLVKRIRLFLLRRTKKEVLEELPLKSEETRYVELTQNQLSLYQHALEHIRERAEEAIAENRIGKAQIEVLAGLTRLRQICCHPGLIHSQYRQSSSMSGKMNTFENLLEQCLQNGRKVLVFSQFVQMLDIISERLHHRSINHLRLDGRTIARQEMVDRFNRNAEIHVFLISLKSGGYGLNLTSADVVILYDPWWNPMAEDQAADRAHRMGQANPVTVYRLITQKTIEEKMMLLQKRKRHVFDQIVNDDTAFIQKLTIDDLLFLLNDEMGRHS